MIYDDDEDLIRRPYKMKERITLDKWDDTDFVFRFRVSKRSFRFVLSLIEDQLGNGQQRYIIYLYNFTFVLFVRAFVLICVPSPRYIQPTTQLLIALRFFALGSIQLSVADFAGVSTASVCRILKKVSGAIASISSQFIKMPATDEEMLESCKGLL